MQGDSLSDCADEELLTRFCLGQAEAFGLLVKRYEKELYGYLFRYLNDRNLADDVFQNTFLQLYTKVATYQQGKPVRPWLYTIATHQAIDALRRAGRHQAISLDQGKADKADGQAQALVDLIEGRDGEPLDHLQAEEQQQRVRASLEQLPEFMRQVVVLAYYQGLKYREIADILNVPVGTVKSRLHAALVKLQGLWAASPSLGEV